MDLSTFIVLLAAASAANAATITQNSSRNSEIRQFNNTSVFKQVVPSSDDAIIRTPSVMFVGKRNGDILRCLVKEPSVCELFDSHGSTEVTAIAVHGEFIFVSLAGGNMLKCELHEKNSCKTFDSSVNPAVSAMNGLVIAGIYIYVGYLDGRMARCDLTYNTCEALTYLTYRTGIQYVYFVNSLVVAGGYIYMGLQDGRMVRCDLIYNYHCKALTRFHTGIKSLAATDKYIYAALGDNAEIMRCSIGSEDSCRLVTNDTGSYGFDALYAVEDTVYGITSNALWNCTRGNPCTKEFFRECTSMTAFDRSLYIAHSNTSISVCELNSKNCSFYDQIEGARSIAFAYSTLHGRNSPGRYGYQPVYWAEYINNLEIIDRPRLEVFVKGSKLYNSQGGLVDTRDAELGHFGPAAIFAMGADGQILLSKVHKTGFIRSTSLFAGHPVSGAGEIVVEDGVIMSIRACSDNYRPDVELNQQVISALFMKGYTKRIESLPCCSDDKCGQVNVKENTIGDIQ